jgi:hypothetical protein
MNTTPQRYSSQAFDIGSAIIAEKKGGLQQRAALALEEVLLEEPRLAAVVILSACEQAVSGGPVSVRRLLGRLAAVIDAPCTTSTRI